REHNCPHHHVQDCACPDRSDRNPSQHSTRSARGWRLLVPAPRAPERETAESGGPEVEPLTALVAKYPSPREVRRDNLLKLNARLQGWGSCGRQNADVQVVRPEEQCIVNDFARSGDGPV